MTVPTEVRRLLHGWEARGRPLQAAVPWQRDSWVARYPALAGKFNALPARLDRATVRSNVLSMPSTEEGMFDAMIATYAWGWSQTRVGLARAGRVLNAGAVGVGPALLGARERVLAEGPLAGYWALAGAHKVDGLGPAFGSKFLYFCSATDARALIVDRLVADRVTERTPLSITASRFVKSRYERYLDAMTDWAQDIDLEAHELEELIFSDEARRRSLPGWGQ